MPKEITHILFSDATFNLLEKNNLKLANIIENNLDFYHLGCISVDSFYYNLKLPFDKPYYNHAGDMIHGAEGNDTALAFRNCCEYLKNNKNEKNFDKKLAFITGFVTHMAMDINFHPYVYYFSGNYYDDEPSKRVDAMMKHRLIEAWIDLYLLDKMNLSLDKFNSLKNIEKNKSDNYEVMEFLCKFFSEAWNIKEEIVFPFKRGYNIQIFLNNYFMGNKNVKAFFRLLNDIFDNKLRDYLALFYPDNVKDIPNYIVNFGNYIHPVTGKKFEGSIHDIWENALKLSFNFLKSINDYIFEDLSKNDFEYIFRGYSLDVGLEGVKVYEVKHFAPWDLVP